MNRNLRTTGRDCLLFFIVSTLAMVLAGPAPCLAEVIAHRLYKSRIFIQTSQDSPLPIEDPSYRFEAVVETDADDRVLTAVLQPPTGGPIFLGKTSVDHWGISESFDTPSDLNAAHPDGDHDFTITMEGGASTLPATLATDFLPAPASPTSRIFRTWIPLNPSPFNGTTCPIPDPMILSSSE